MFDLQTLLKDAGMKDEIKKTPMLSSVSAILEFVKDDVVGYIKHHGPVALCLLVGNVKWPAILITLALGALIERGLLKAIQHEQMVFILGDPV